MLRRPEQDVFARVLGVAANRVLLDSVQDIRIPSDITGMHCFILPKPGAIPARGFRPFARAVLLRAEQQR